MTRGPSGEDLERIARSYEEGDLAAARRAIDGARARHPEDPDLLEWDAVVLAAEFRPAAALTLLDRLAGQSGKSREAWIQHERGRCLDRLGREKEADAAFARAATLHPREHPAPSRMPDAVFRDLVDRALAGIPEEFRSLLDQVAVVVADHPRPIHGDAELFGLYSGVPLTSRGHELEGHLDHIFIFKRNLETAFPDPEELEEEIRRTVVHELAHHFGIEHDAMGDYA